MNERVSGLDPFGTEQVRVERVQGPVRCCLGLVLLACACAKPLALAPAPPQTTTTTQSAPSDPPREDDPHRYQMPRDPQGGYANDDGPPPRDPAAPRDPLPPPHHADPIEPDPPAPQEPRCKRREFVVERCITGGMPRQGSNGLEARTSCTTRCEATPPTAHPSRRCRKIDARHYQCTSFAP